MADPVINAATGQPDTATPIDPLPMQALPRPGLITFNLDATLKSPFFWMLIGVGGTLLVLYYFQPRR
jgi:hypothetical protein